ncbi:hypothetical protein MPSEU_000356600 [Mayamaea pseudoterrestris]|nr:hypothetical protein MPSEU_000356600 [Mayamaea pseudoterrestris]
MRASNKHRTVTNKNDSNSIQSTSFLQRYIHPLYQHLALESRYDIPFIVFLLIMEVTIGRFIIRRVPYTEIDWKAYMEQVEATQAGERNYLNIRGNTGPLVYPAGFLCLFGLLHELTDNGSDIVKAQHFFLVFYMLMQLIVLMIFQERISTIRRQGNKQTSLHAFSIVNNIWSWRIAMGVLCLSKRLHSIFLLRLFNDGPTMLLLYASILLFQKHYWRMGCLMFSFAVSVKMNILLFAPGLLLLLLQALPDWMSVVRMLAFYCALPQLALGAPFLLAHPVSYLRKAFEFDRTFFYEWTVNWKFLPEKVFVSKRLSLLLLALHIIGLIAGAVAWVRSSRRQVPRTIFLKGVSLSPHYIAYTLLASNFIGIVFARTLHYQFYSWYFHAVPYLLWTALTRQARNFLPKMVACLAILVGIEAAYLTFPATPQSSAMLQVCHLLVLSTIRPPKIRDVEVCSDAKVKSR